MESLKQLPLDIPNKSYPQTGIYCGGRPRQEQFDQVKEMGIAAVINLCPIMEACSFDEETEVKRLGLAYTNIPISGPSDLTIENARLLSKALSTATADQPVLLHCASGNRVGALLALKARWIDGYSSEDAIALGVAGGLTGLLPVVQLLIA
ncbi:MAG: hypothetical protein KGO49_00600 [Gammaproteobacteria bacterium]|nr:hypothetical protein [Gammaproteobacteria bacterium]